MKLRIGRGGARQAAAIPEMLVLAMALCVAGPLALFGLAPLPAAAETVRPKPAEIDRNGVIILIRTTLIALDQANKTGNYTVLRDLGAPAFQANTAAALAEIFAALRREKLDLSGVAVIDPQLSVLPEIEPNGLMHMRGFFPSAPTQINFDLTYAPVGGQWRLLGLSVGLGQAGPVAPTPPQARAPLPAHKPGPSSGKAEGAQGKRSN